MTGREAAQILFKHTGWLRQGIDPEYNDDESEFIIALSMGSNALTILEQIKYERDVAIDQLRDIGVEFGEKMEGVYLSKDEYDELVEYKNMYEGLE